VERGAPEQQIAHISKYHSGRYSLSKTPLNREIKVSSHTIQNVNGKKQAKKGELRLGGEGELDCT
jgi:hypothetical protein